MSKKLIGDRMTPLSTELWNVRADLIIACNIVIDFSVVVVIFSKMPLLFIEAGGWAYFYNLMGQIRERNSPKFRIKLIDTF